MNSVTCQMRDACRCVTHTHPAPYVPHPAGDGHPWQISGSPSYFGWQPQGTSSMYSPWDVTMAACPSGRAVVAVADSPALSNSLRDGAAPTYVPALSV